MFNTFPILEQASFHGRLCTTKICSVRSDLLYVTRKTPVVVIVIVVWDCYKMKILCNCYNIKVFFFFTVFYSG